MSIRGPQPALLAFLVIIACGAPPPAPIAPLDPPPVESPGAGHHSHADLDPTGPAQGPAQRAQRLSLEQTAASFITVLGQPWTFEYLGQRYSIEFLYGALGSPDYFVRLAEAMDPHLLYAKFLEDGAYAACADAVEADLTVPLRQRHVLREVEPSDDLTTAPDRVRANLRDLKLRFHGVRIPPDRDEALAPYVELFGAVTALPSESPLAAWRAVCVALVTEPEFSAN